MASKKSKRGQNEGSIRKIEKSRKDSTKYFIYEARYTVGFNGEGKQNQKSIYGKSVEEVRKKLQSALNNINTGSYLEPSKMTIGEWLDIWFKEYIGNSVKLATKVSYDMIIRQHLKKHFDKVKLKDLRPDMIQKAYNTLLESGRVDGKGGLSAKTIKNIHNVLHEALEQANKNDLIFKNPSEAVILPQAVKKEMRVLTQQEQTALQHEANKHRLGMAIILDLFTGLRQGELLALTWKDLNTKTGELSVSKSLNRLKNFDPKVKAKTSIVIGDTKTKKSNRVIPLPDSIISRLKSYKVTQSMERMRLGKAWQDNDLIFCTEEGKHIEPKTFQDFYKRLLKNAEIAEANIHAIRHTFATRALEAGIPAKTVSEILGHSSIGITLDLYSHVSQELKKQSMEKIMELFAVNPIEAEQNQRQTNKYSKAN